MVEQRIQVKKPTNLTQKAKAKNVDKTNRQPNQGKENMRFFRNLANASRATVEKRIKIESIKMKRD